MTGTASESERQLVVFTLHGEQYALPVTTVREIIRYIAPSATATASGLIRGMISLRGQVLPIVDLSVRLGETLEIGDGTRILVIELDGGPVGLIVDRVDGVRLIPIERIAPLPVAADDGLGDEIAAVDDRLIILLDAERALANALPERQTSASRAETADPATTAADRAETASRGEAAVQAKTAVRAKTAARTKAAAKPTRDGR
jgi:purine-binding chemotaxis protein CheW